jgi:hypothetical protein
MNYNSICVHAEKMLDRYDVTGLAMDEIEFHSRLNLRPVSWELGLAVFQILLEEAKILVPLLEQAKILVPEITEDSSPLFFGLPVKVMEEGNPWTIKLISTDHP